VIFYRCLVYIFTQISYVLSRTHPEAGAVANMPYQCEMCERSFVAKSQYLKHKMSHENQSSDNKEDDEPEPPPATNVSKVRFKNNLYIESFSEKKLFIYPIDSKKSKY
jgi:hypothetical protein